MVLIGSCTSGTVCSHSATHDSDKYRLAHDLGVDYYDHGVGKLSSLSGVLTSSQSITRRDYVSTKFHVCDVGTERDKKCSQRYEVGRSLVIQETIIVTRLV